MKICMLTTTHPPHDARIFQKETNSLVKEHEVTIIAPSAAGGSETTGNVRIVSVKKPESRVLHFLTIVKAFLACLRQDCDVMHCHEPDALLIGMLAGRLTGRRVIYDVHEHWPSEIPFDLGIDAKTLAGRVLGSAVAAVELALARRADRIIAVSESVAERFRERGENPVIVSNYSHTGLQLPPISGGRNHRRLMYVAGSMHLHHGIRECVQAVSSLQDTYPDLSLTLIGNLRESPEEIAGSHPEARIRLTGYLPYAQMYEELNRGGIGLLLFRPDYYNIYIGLPNKLFDYMLLGLPIIATDLPEIGRIIREADCGILVDPADAAGIAEAIAYLAERPDEAVRMGANGRRAVEERYNWGRMEGVLLDVYRILERSGN